MDVIDPAVWFFVRVIEPGGAGGGFACFGDSCTIPLLTPVSRPNSRVIARPSTGDVSFAFGILVLLSMLLFGARGSVI